MQARPGDSQCHTERCWGTQNGIEGHPWDQCDKGGVSVSGDGGGMLSSILFSMLERFHASEQSRNKNDGGLRKLSLGSLPAPSSTLLSLMETAPPRADPSASPLADFIPGPQPQPVSGTWFAHLPQGMCVVG